MDDLVSTLINRRVLLGMNQMAVAHRMGCTQSWVAKLENKSSLHWTVKDLDAYAKAVEMKLELLLSPSVTEWRVEATV